MALLLQPPTKRGTSARTGTILGRRGSLPSISEGRGKHFNLRLCALLIESLNEKGRYDPDDYLQRYIDFMTTPGRHGTPISRNAIGISSAGTHAGVPLRSAAWRKNTLEDCGNCPDYRFLSKSSRAAKQAAFEHLSLTHPGVKMQAAASLLNDLLLEVLG